MAFETATTFGAGPEILILLLLALLIDAYVGDMGWLFGAVPHPVAVAGRMIGGLDRRLNREHRGDGERRVRGALVVLVMVAGAGVLGWAIHWLAISVPLGWLAELFLLVALIAQRSLFDHVRAVATALEQDGIAAARAAVGHIIGRNTDELDSHAIARGAVESCAENYADGVVAPCFWYVLLGLPGLMIYKVVNTMDSMIGYRSPRYLAFGWAAARLDDVLNYLPARLAGAMIAAAAAFVPTANPFAAFRTMWRDARKHRSPNAGWTEAAMAGALDLALNGPRRYGADVLQAPWVGDGRARATPKDIRRALFVFIVACVINGLLVALATAGRMASGV